MVINSEIQQELLPEAEPYAGRLANRVLLFRERVKQLMTLHGFTLTELAKAAKVKLSYLSRILSPGNSGNVTLETIVKLEDALNGLIVATPIEIENDITTNLDRATAIYRAAQLKATKLKRGNQQNRRSKATSHIYKQINVNRGEVEVIERTFSDEPNTFSNAIAA